MRILWSNAVEVESSKSESLYESTTLPILAMHSWLHKRAKRWWSHHFLSAIPTSLGYTVPTGEIEYLIDPSVFDEGTMS